MNSKVKITNIDQISNVACNVEERETSITFGYLDKQAEIFTSDNTIITKIKKCMIKDPNNWECFEAGRIDGNVTGYFFVTKKSNIALRSLQEREKRQLSDEERKLLGERLHKKKL